MTPDDRHEGPRDRRRPTRAEAMGIPPSIGRRPRPDERPPLDPRDGLGMPADGDRADAGAPAAPGPARRERRAQPPADGRAEKEMRRHLEAAEEALEIARAEARETNDRYVRLAAEMDNVRRRHRQEQADQLQHANGELLTRLLPVVDNFHRALEHAPAIEGDAGGQWVNGVTMVLRQLEEILAAAGVEPIAAVGEDFDPAVHQAVMAEESEEHDDGKVIDELQRGYRLHDRVLRPSMVKVSRRT
ncbi:MAG: molecular chaperone GrpE [Chloroflexota bacterium]|jgi:molecular chaperone GrpE|nr:molecular chaperone GrpE [Chloroflexota bacterium]